jgi:hypothetical protein
MTFCYPPGHWLYEFNADNWAAAVALHSQSHPHREPFPGKISFCRCTKL